ncbi:MAG: sialate O-acetylesterase [Clostridia bacterium]|nr:sialate O-acetylesterase [Clostridia bacterium]
MKAVLNPIFRDHMVLQADAPIRIFGEGDGNITVSLSGNTAEAVCKDGAFIAELPPMPAGGPYTVTVNIDGDVTTLDDVMIGQVYILAGQSNMQFRIADSAKETTVFDDNPMVRMYATARLEGADYMNPERGWVKCDKEVGNEWSAIGYDFGNLLQEKIGCAVGLITCFQGASIIESWMTEEVLASVGPALADEDKHIDHFQKPYSVWNGTAVLYNFVVKQIAPFVNAGVLWYQGESDTSVPEGKIYDKELAAMITLWRETFMQPKMPFTIIQIADFDPRRDEGWRAVQEAQLRMPEIIGDVCVVTSADVCESNEIHPPTKMLLAKKLVSAVL